MKKVAGRIKLDLAQFRELEAFMQFASDLDEDTKKRIDGGRRLTAVLNQDKHAPMAFERQVVVIYAATNGYLDTVDPSIMHEVEQQLLSFMDREHATILGNIREEKVISEETEGHLKGALETFVKTLN